MQLTGTGNVEIQSRVGQIYEVFLRLRAEPDLQNLFRCAATAVDDSIARFQPLSLLQSLQVCGNVAGLLF
jgi:hypothetical protein